MNLLVLAHRALGIPGTELARLCEVTPKTVYRWYAGRTSVTAISLRDLPQHVYPRDPALAKRIHAYATRELAGSPFVPPPLPVPAPPAPAVAPEAAAAPEPPVAPEARAPRAMRVEAVVHAVCEALDAGPRTVRPAVHAAFRRALELALSVDDVVQELAPPPKKRRR